MLACRSGASEHETQRGGLSRGATVFNPIPPQFSPPYPPFRPTLSHLSVPLSRHPILERLGSRPCIRSRYTYQVHPSGTQPLGEVSKGPPGQRYGGGSIRRDQNSVQCRVVRCRVSDLHLDSISLSCWFTPSIPFKTHTRPHAQMQVQTWTDLQADHGREVKCVGPRRAQAGAQHHGVATQGRRLRLDRGFAASGTSFDSCRRTCVHQVETPTVGCRTAVVCFDV